LRLGDALHPIALAKPQAADSMVIDELIDLPLRETGNWVPRALSVRRVFRLIAPKTYGLLGRGSWRAAHEPRPNGA
jgi:hypothetical protein